MAVVFDRSHGNYPVALLIIFCMILEREIVDVLHGGGLTVFRRWGRHSNPKDANLFLLLLYLFPLVLAELLAKLDQLKKLGPDKVKHSAAIIATFSVEFVVHASDLVGGQIILRRHCAEILHLVVLYLLLQRLVHHPRLLTIYLELLKISRAILHIYLHLRQRRFQAVSGKVVIIVVNFYLLVFWTHFTIFLASLALDSLQFCAFGVELAAKFGLSLTLFGQSVDKLFFSRLDEVFGS